MINLYNAKRREQSETVRSEILKAISQYRSLTIPQIAEKTNKAKSHIYSAIQPLILSGQVIHSGEMRDEENRKARLFSLTGKDMDQPILQNIIAKSKRLKGPFASMIAQMHAHQGRL